MFPTGPVRSLAVCVPDFEAVAVGRPASTPVVVVHGNRIRAVSPAAREHGIVGGLRRREAQSRCPSVEVHELDESRDVRAFEPVLSALEELAPRIEVLAPGRCVIPTRGPSRYHGGDRALATLVAERVRAALGDEFVCPVGVGVADGPRAAQLVAAESVRTDTVIVVPPGATAAFLAPIPVAQLRLIVGGGERPAARSGSGAGSGRGSRTGAAATDLADLLGRMGIRTLGHFAALGAPDVSARFGAVGRDAHLLVTGAEDRPPDVVDPPADLRVSVELDPPVERVETAAFSAKALADELHTGLASRGLACIRVAVAFETVGGDRQERLWRHEGALSASAMAQRVRWQLDGWLRSGQRHRSVDERGDGAIRLIELFPDEVTVDAGRQLGFWGGADDGTERALRALARVQGLVGHESVLVPERSGGRGPADRIELVVVDSVDLTQRVERPAAPWPGAVPAPAPALVWSELRPVEVLDAVGGGVTVSGRGHISAPPVRCRIAGGVPATVRSWAGPWCSDERWWDPVGHRRRARLQVVLDTPPGPTAHLLSLESGVWWLEATYD
jgi:protein ImuB